MHMSQHIASQIRYLICLYSPCDYTPNAATLAVTTGRVSLWQLAVMWSMETKNNIFGTQQQYSTCRYSYGGSIGIIVTWAVAQRLHAPLSFWQRTPQQKRLHTFLALNAETCFSNLKHESIPLTVQKKYWLLCRKAGQINLTLSTPLCFGWTITLKSDKGYLNLGCPQLM